MNDSSKLVLRLALGLLVLLHGIAKLRHGIGAITGMVGGAVLPAWVAYGVYIGEVAAPLMVIAGWYARIGGAIIAINMLFAFGLAHLGHLFELGPVGGWALELQGMYLASALAVAMIGPGRYGLNER